MPAIFIFSGLFLSSVSLKKMSFCGLRQSGFTWKGHLLIKVQKWIKSLISTLWCAKRVTAADYCLISTRKLFCGQSERYRACNYASIIQADAIIIGIRKEKEINKLDRYRCILHENRAGVKRKTKISCFKQTMTLIGCI